METTIMGYIGIMEKKMETTIMGYIGIMEKKMETTIMGTNDQDSCCQCCTRVQTYLSFVPA